jgi:serine/threonine protein kinase
LAQFCDHSIQTYLSSEDQAIGTLAYMAPEQLFRNEEVTTRADIFSLGVTLYEILTGQRPLERPGHTPLMAELSSIRPDVDDGLSSLITKMCFSGTTMSHIVRFAQFNSLRQPHSSQMNAVCELQESFGRLVFSSYKESDRGW